ncbi:hypothetical protein AGMMS49975_06490 [Clostridia bacterium]|nr:hypothetical protein AGMMS49975_06490 [Clostridia bacterium]
MTFGEIADKYVATFAANVLSTTSDGYGYWLNKVAGTEIQGKRLREYKIWDINRSVMQEIFNGLSRYGESGVQKRRFLANSVFECALDDGLIEKNL